MTIRFSCHSCGKSLSTTDERAGRTAKCPQCGEKITVPAAEVEFAEFVDEVEDYEPEDKLPPLPTAQKSVRAGKSCPMCGAKVGNGVRECPDCGEVLSKDRRDSDERMPATVNSGEVLSDAIKIYQANLGTLLIAWLVNRFALSVIIMIAAGVIMIPLGATFFGLIAGANRGNDAGIVAGALATLMLGYLLLIMISSVLQIVMDFGWCRSCLAVVSGGPADLGVQFSGFTDGFGSIVAAGLCVLLISVASYLLLIPGLLVFALSVPVWYCIADGRPRGLAAMKEGFRIGGENFGALLLLSLLAGIMNMALPLVVVVVMAALGTQEFAALAGMAVMGVSLLLTLPFTSVLFAVAYQRATGGRVRAA